MKTHNILLSGVGGQGVLLASKILSKAALIDGRDIKQSEVHGMSQRGGSVASHVRIGEQVFSPIVPAGGCSLLVGFEPLEALRLAHLVARDGYIVYCTDRINPSTVSAGFAEYPEDVLEQIEGFECAGKAAVNANELALAAGNLRSANVAMVGALSNYLDFTEATWAEALKQAIPASLLGVNVKAFAAGRDAI